MLTNLGESPIDDFGRVSDVMVDGSGRVIVAGVANDPSAPFSIARLTPDGELDQTFANGGVLQPAFGSQIAVTPGGAVLVGGEVGAGVPGLDLAIRRYTSSGTLDRSFGRDGLVRINLGAEDTIEDLFVQPGGTIVAFGRALCHGSDPQCGFTSLNLALVRFDQDGRRLRTVSANAENLVDAWMSPQGEFVALAWTFENEHSVLARFAADGSLVKRIESNYEDRIYASHLARQASGQVILGGRPLTRLLLDDSTPDPVFDGEPPPCDPPYEGLNTVEVLPDQRVMAAGGCGLAMFDSDGAPEAAFGSGGLVNTGLRAEGFAVEANGSSVVADWERDAGGFVVKRYQSDGQPDSGFGSGGRAEVPLTAPTTETGAAAARGPGGRITVAGGYRCIGNTCGGFALARYLRNGRLDPSFGGDGRVVTTGRGLGGGRALAVYPNGATIVGGGSAGDDFALARFTPSGELDTTFGDQGAVFTTAHSPGERSVLNGLALQRDGRIVSAGYASGCPDLCIVVARYLRNGELDQSFAGDGLVRVQVRGTRGDTANAVAIQRDGRVVTVGGGYGAYVVARFKPNGRLDRSFGGDGTVVTPHKTQFSGAGGDQSITDFSRDAKAVGVTRAGKIIAAGGASNGKGLVIRYHRNGQVDRSFGRRGRLSLPTLSVTGLANRGCGLAFSGTTRTSGTPAMGVAAVPRNGVRRGGEVRVRTPFGDANRSFGNAITASSRSKLAVVGRFERSYRSGDFALAGYLTGKLVPGCGR